MSGSARIVFFADASSVHTRRWVAEAVARGARAVVVSREPGEVPGADAVHVLAPGQDKLGWLLALPRVRRLARQLSDSFQPTLVHGHYVTSYGLWAAACGLRAPLVLTAWGSDILVTPRESRLMRWLVTWSLRRADLVTADSLDMVEAIAGYQPHAAVHQILWGADTERFVPAPAASDFEVVSLRNWEANYNIDTVLEGFARFVNKRPQSHARLHLLGGGPLRASLQDRVAALRLLQQVKLHGRQDDRGMLDLMQRCRVSVSVPTSDATSVSVLESMSCGLAIVASDLPANRQWLDARGGWLVPVRDADALAEALLDAYDHPEATAAKGAVNRRKVLSEASRRVEMDRMWTLYLQLLRPNVKADRRRRPPQERRP